ncbi:MAG: hypothetical protein LPK45_09040 [Bacteroidota bacterium]|nr:hypothetical protein [Bacteroidota bacterium]MDX5431228.1 hypothetical protein [Bacteroidota bacterium]MDX5469967.1 hypothetical protein [Bacteroidota bacterium]
MEITDKDFELVDNYLEGNLSDEEIALFRIRMQDGEFAGLLRFQQQLRKELNQPSLLGIDQWSQAEHFYHEYKSQRRRRFVEGLYSKWWMLAVAIMCFTSVLLALVL